MPSKRGIGWPWDYPASQFPLWQPYADSGKISWLFNWELWRPEGTPSNIEWVPCVRTAAQAKDIDPFLSDIIHNKGVRVSHFLGFNEPELGDQANMSVDEAVKLYHETIMPAKKKFGFRLGSPGMTSDVGKCKPWLNEFFSKLGPMKHEIDFLVVHWYGQDFEQMKSYLQDMHQTYGIPLWVNEFACSSMGAGQPDLAQVGSFLDKALPWLENCEWVERYAYYGNGQGRDVGDWVGKANNFTEPVQGHSENDGRRLSKLGQRYCEA